MFEPALPIFASTIYSNPSFTPFLYKHFKSLLLYFIFIHFYIYIYIKNLFFSNEPLISSTSIHLYLILLFLLHGATFSMAKRSHSQLRTQKNNATNIANNLNATNTVPTKVKRTRRSVPRDSPPQRSSIYRGVTRLIHMFFDLNLFNSNNFTYH